MATPLHDYSNVCPTVPTNNPLNDPIQELSEQLFGPSYPQPQTTYETEYTHHTAGSTAGSSSTFAPPTIGASSDQIPEIQTIEEEPVSTPPGPRKRKNPRPHYNATWWRYFEQTIDPATGKCISARCKVKGCKSSFTYDDNNSSMGRHAAKHIKNGQEPQERPDSTHIQTLINPDGTRTHQKYDEKKC